MRSRFALGARTRPNGTVRAALTLAAAAVIGFKAAGRRKDGQLVEIATTIAALGDADRRETGASAISHDTTEHERAERARARALQDLEEAQRVAKIGSFTWDPQAQKAAWSAQYFEICGRDPALGAPTAEQFMATYMSPEEAERFRVELERQQREGGCDVDGDWRITTEAGDQRIVHIVGRADPARPGCYLGTAQDVTERRGAEAQRERALRDLEAAQRIANIGSFTWDPATDSATWSKQLFEIFERDPALGTPGAQGVLSYLQEDERKRWLYSVAQREMQIDDDWRIITDTGRERTVHMTADPDPANRGRFVGTCQDVTEQRRAHDELRRERDFNDATLAVAGAPIIVTDADWRIVRFNRQSELLSGCGEAQALGRPYDFLVPPEERARMRANIETAQAGQIVTQENHLIARSGERRLIRWSNQVLRDEAGAFTHLIAVGIDITEQRRAELALTAAEERFRRAFDEAPIGMALLSPDGVLRKANTSLGVICGRELSELEGTRLDALLPPRDVESLGRALSELAAGRQVITELRIALALGSLVHVAMHGTLLRGHGQTPQLLCQFQDVTERKRFEAQLQFMADHDPLTGLWNRRRFESELDLHVQTVKRYGPGGALLILDVDDFKAVNDTLGHNVGDQLIVSLASVLRDRLRESDVLARFGGDEFAVLLPHANRTAAGQVAGALVNAVRTNTSLPSGERKKITCSIGIAMFESQDIGTERSMIEADLAMYDVKAADGNGYSFSTTELASGTKARLTWMAHVERALDEDGFELAAQPILDLRSDEVHQYELLLRMRDDGELIPPSAFLSIAERFGLIGRIDEWVVSHAIALLAQHPELQLEVNISGKSLGDQLLLTHIDRCLHEHRIDPTHLIFEVTETAAVANITHAKSFAEHLRDHGCRFALDDFGAGFGSFYYLKHLPFDFVKIDGEFVQHAAATQVDRLVIEAVVGIAQGLGKETIAEFVVDEATKQMVKDLAVDYAQGHHIGKPLPVSELFSFSYPMRA